MEWAGGYTYVVLYQKFVKASFMHSAPQLIHSIEGRCLYLQDQYDQIAVHTQKGIDFLEKYGNFVDQRCKIEQEYASKLRWVPCRKLYGTGLKIFWGLPRLFIITPIFSGTISVPTPYFMQVRCVPVAIVLTVLGCRYRTVYCVRYCAVYIICTKCRVVWCGWGGGVVGVRPCILLYWMLRFWIE